MLDRAQEFELVRGVVGGDPHATAELVLAMQGPLFAYLLRMSRSHHTAEEMTQEALYRAILHIERFDNRWRFSTWVFTIGRRLLSNAQHRRGPRVDSAVVDEVAPVTPVWGVRGWPEERGEEARERQHGQRQQIERALQSLSESQQEVVVLFHQLEWSIAQIAELTGLPEGTVKSQLYRARTQLRVLLSKAWADEVGQSGRSVREGLESRPSGAAQAGNRTASEGRASVARRHRGSREDAS